jgi:hypothetical protein
MIDIMKSASEPQLCLTRIFKPGNVIASAKEALKSKNLLSHEKQFASQVIYNCDRWQDLRTKATAHDSGKNEPSTTRRTISS